MCTIDLEDGRRVGRTPRLAATESRWPGTISGWGR